MPPSLKIWSNLMCAGAPFWAISSCALSRAMFGHRDLLAPAVLRVGASLWCWFASCQGGTWTTRSIEWHHFLWCHLPQADLRQARASVLFRAQLPPRVVSLLEQRPPGAWGWGRVSLSSTALVSRRRRSPLVSKPQQ